MKKFIAAIALFTIIAIPTLSTSVTRPPCHRPAPTSAVMATDCREPSISSTAMFSDRGSHQSIRLPAAGQVAAWVAVRAIGFLR